MTHQITIYPHNLKITAEHGDQLLAVLQSAGLAPDAPCGGKGSCQKCKVTIDGKEVLACRTMIESDLEVTLPVKEAPVVLMIGNTAEYKVDPVEQGALLVFDIGTTTLAGCLLDGKTGEELAVTSLLNPQTSYGADVISRIQYTLSGYMQVLTNVIGDALESMIQMLCEKADILPHQIGVVSIVGNPAMQQLFLGILPENLAQIPFAPLLTEARIECAEAYLPSCKNAKLLIVPNISGFIGADTVACILATDMYKKEEITLLVDIGTNGEMVLGNQQRMAACSTAAGPALEGANIQFGMRASEGAIDHVWQENGTMHTSVIGGKEAVGICGSGLIDVIATALELGMLNERGRIQNEDRRIYLTDQVFLTQEDVREVQMAKGAIAAGIELLTNHLGITYQDIDKVCLAGAFGSYMDPKSACGIGLLPKELEEKIEAVGNAALGGGKMLARDQEMIKRTEWVIGKTEFLELSQIPEFQRCFAKNMRFSYGKILD